MNHQVIITLLSFLLLLLAGTAAIAHYSVPVSRWWSRKRWGYTADEWDTRYQQMLHHVRPFPLEHEIDEQPFRYPPVDYDELQRKAKS